MCCEEQKTAPGAFVTGQAEQLVGKTVPPGAFDVARAAPSHHGSSGTTSWEFETNWAQRQYTRWVTEQLQTQFEIRKSTQFNLVFARDLGGDSETLQLEMTPKAERLFVRVILQTYPD